MENNLMFPIVNIGRVPGINRRIAKPAKTQYRIGMMHRCFIVATRIRFSSTITNISFFFKIYSNREVF